MIIIIYKLWVLYGRLLCWLGIGHSRDKIERIERCVWRQLERGTRPERSAAWEWMEQCPDGRWKREIHWTDKSVTVEMYGDEDIEYIYANVVRLKKRS
jgi:hypothetical protein